MARWTKPFPRCTGRVTYVDTAQGYGNGQSWIGEGLVGRRDKVFLVTKCGARDADGAARMIEGSLKRRIRHKPRGGWSGTSGQRKTGW